MWQLFKHFYSLQKTLFWLNLFILWQLFKHFYSLHKNHFHLLKKWQHFEHFYSIRKHYFFNIHLKMIAFKQFYSIIKSLLLLKIHSQCDKFLNNFYIILNKFIQNLIDFKHLYNVHNLFKNILTWQHIEHFYRSKKHFVQDDKIFFGIFTAIKKV